MIRSHMITDTACGDGIEAQAQRLEQAGLLRTGDGLIDINENINNCNINSECRMGSGRLVMHPFESGAKVNQLHSGINRKSGHSP